MNKIIHLVEPERLLLCWKSLQSSRNSYIVGEILRKKENDFFLSYHQNTPDFKSAKDEGFIGLLGFPPDNQPAHGYHQGVMDSLLRRIPPRSRTDFPKYLENHGLQEVNQISDFALLGYTEGRLPGDTFFFIHPFDNQSGPLEFILEIVELAHHESIVGNPADPLTFARDQSNLHDPNAVAVLLREKKMGFVNRCQTLSFQFWLTHACKVSGKIHRLTGSQEKPRWFAFVEVCPTI